MATTLGETTPAVTDQLGTEPLAWATGDWEVLAPVLIWATGENAISVPITAYVPALARTAATTAMAPNSANLRGLPD
jgi:hypothetical protein